MKIRQPLLYGLKKLTLQFQYGILEYHLILNSSNWQIPNHTRFVATNDDACNCNKLNDHILSPWIHLNGYDSLLLEFKAFFNQGFFDGVEEAAYVFYRVGSQNIYIDTLAGNMDWKNHSYPLILADTIDSLQIGFTYSDQGGWMFGVALDNISLSVLKDIDLSVESILSDDIYAVADFVSPEIKITNYGYDTARHVVIYGNYDTITYLKKINTILLPFSSVWLSLDSLFNVQQYENQSFTYWVKDSLGLDTQTENDTLSRNFLVIPTQNYKNVLVESFTSNTCIPCVNAQSNFSDILEINAVNTGGNLYHIEYHLLDDAFVSEHLKAQSRYDSLTLPYYILQGKNEPQSTEFFDFSDVTLLQQEYSNLMIENNYYIIGDSIFITVDLSGLTTQQIEEERLVSVLVERNTNIDSNDSRQVLRKYLTEVSGLYIADTIHTGTTISFSFAEKIQVTDTNSSLFSNITDNIALVSYIQNQTTLDVQQVHGLQWPLNLNKTSSDNVQNLHVFPNPSSSENIYISGFLSSNEVLQVDLYNIHGQQVWSTIATSSGTPIKLEMPENIHGFFQLRARSKTKHYQAKIILQ